eukprot:10048568-Alexandrium_andersonii.AAC.1
MPTYRPPARLPAALPACQHANAPAPRPIPKLKDPDGSFEWPVSRLENCKGRTLGTGLNLGDT